MSLYNVFYYNNLVNPAKYEVTVNNKAIELTATEFAILYFLIQNAGYVFSRNQDFAVSERTIDVQILSLCRKLGKQGKDMETVRGIGNKIKD